MSEHAVALPTATDATRAAVREAVTAHPAARDGGDGSAAMTAMTTVAAEETAAAGAAGVDGEAMAAAGVGVSPAGVEGNDDVPPAAPATRLR